MSNLKSDISRPFSQAALAANVKKSCITYEDIRKELGKFGISYSCKQIGRWMRCECPIRDSCYLIIYYLLAAKSD